MEFTPVGFHLQQPRASVTNNEKVSFTCNLCPASFPYLSTLTLHKRSHNKEEGRAEGRDGLIGRGQQLDEASGWQKNPVVLLVSFRDVCFTCDMTFSEFGTCFAGVWMERMIWMCT